jgi:hypothetical protein
MKNIFVQNTYNKLINNLHYINLPDIKFYFDNVKNNLYKLYYNLKLSDCIFSSSSMNDEIVSFINDNTNNSNIKIYIYHDMYNEHLINIMPKCYHIIDEDNYTNNGIKFPKNIINTDIYKINPNIVKKDRIVLFLEKETDISDSVKNKLYPNETKILMFNNGNIPHDQNIGFLSEITRSEILQESRFFACNNSYYAIEAGLCGCEILDMNNLDNNITKNYEFSSYINYNEYLGKILI